MTDIPVKRPYAQKVRNVSCYPPRTDKKGVIRISISNDDLYKLVNILLEETKQSAYDYLRFLAIGNVRPDWDEIMKMEPDDIPLSAEEKKQLQSNNNKFMSLEDAIKGLNLQSTLNR